MDHGGYDKLYYSGWQGIWAGTLQTKYTLTVVDKVYNGAGSLPIYVSAGKKFIFGGRTYLVMSANGDFITFKEIQ